MVVSCQDVFDSGAGPLERLQQAKAQLHAPALPIGHHVHAPVWVHVQDLHELLPPCWVHAMHAVDHAGGGEVSLQPEQNSIYAASQQPHRGQEAALLPGVWALLTQKNPWLLKVWQFLGQHCDEQLSQHH